MRRLSYQRAWQGQRAWQRPALPVSSQLKRREGQPTRASLALAMLFFILLAFSLQGCLGNSNTTPSRNFKSTSTGSNGRQIAVNQSNSAVFKGKLYFTQGRNLFMLDGTRVPHRLTSGKDVRDPAVSPDGKWIAFAVRYKDYSDLEYMPIQGGPWRMLRTGQGKFYADGPYIKSTYNWYAQPAWAPDSAHLLFLSDLQKNFDWYMLGSPFNQAPFLDLQVFSLALANPDNKPQVVAYASFGDGGDHDPSYRPNFPNQIVYTHYGYDSTGTQQVIQIFLEDATAIANHPYAYSPLKDAGVPLTPANVENIQPAVSPDGKSLAYIRRESSGLMSLYIMPLPTTNVTDDPNNPAIEKKALEPYSKSSLILTQQFVSQPVWSPDGKQIAYLSYNNNEFDIWLISLTIDARTGAYKMKDSPVQLTAGGIDGDSRPCWTR